MAVHVEGSKKDYVDKKTIENSDVFIVLMTKHWVQEPLRIKELEYAKKLGKPIAVAVFDNINPEPYLKNAKVIVKRTFNRKQVESRTPLAEALIKDFIDEVMEKVEKFKRGKNNG